MKRVESITDDGKSSRDRTKKMCEQIKKDLSKLYLSEDLTKAKLGEDVNICVLDLE